jgi:nucleoside-diphosphate-sugar epimerase
MAVEKRQPHTLLLGGGYTLQRLAGVLPEGSFVITSRRETQCREWRAKGWLAEQVEIDNLEALRRIFDHYPALTVLIDSVPPLPQQDCARGVADVVAAVKGTGISRIIYLSTTGVFGVRDGSVVNEQTVCNPQSPGGKARKVCEDQYRRVSEPCRLTVLRLPAIYGPDRGLKLALQQGRYRLIGDGNQWTNRIHVDDLVEILRLSIERAKQLPEILCVADDTQASAREVVSFMCEKESIPFPESISVAEAVERGLHTMLSNQRVSNSLIKEKLGLVLRYPSYREGFYPESLKDDKASIDK